MPAMHVACTLCASSTHCTPTSLVIVTLDMMTEGTAVRRNHVTMRQTYVKVVGHVLRPKLICLHHSAVFALTVSVCKGVCVIVHRSN